MRVITALMAFWVSTSLLAQEPKKPTAPPEELQKLQGTWNLVSWETAGKALNAATLKKRTAFIGANVLMFREDGKIYQAGLLTLDPSKKPARIDLPIKEGEKKDTILLGIYSLEGDTLKICLDVEGESRPKEFQTADKENFQLITLKKPKRPADETIEIVGTYRSEITEPDGKKAESNAKIERRGDGYLITYMNGNRVQYIGTAIRRGNTLSMCWTNGPQAGISVYKIEAGPKLVGEYTPLGGLGAMAQEVLTPAKRAERISIERLPELR
ncbi:MAG: TIGR03067 domain-containing protein [Fimbriiglobus sp.]